MSYQQKRIEAKEAVKQITSENIDAYEDQWFSGNIDVEEFAHTLWDARNELEVERDQEGEVSFEDYHQWVVEEWERKNGNIL